MSQEIENYEITLLRGGAIGLISGVKGGALAGALGGALLMPLRVAAGEPSMVVAFTTIVGLTTGLMAGAVFGGVIGIGIGGVSGSFWPSTPRSLISAVWLIVAVGVALTLAGLLTGQWQPGPLLMGALCGLLGGWWSGRDFVRVAQAQHDDEQNDP
ncbi:MAG: hypothetical protein QNJ45_29110 [Ardenticatenaceae bacterium]|nr:hypothetical protein [Ardenticatenaceae bacterium]